MITIRLKRRGRKHLALYDIVATNVRSKRDGSVLEKLGTYNPMSTITNVTINKNLVFKWLRYGAKISSTVKSLLSISLVISYSQFFLNLGANIRKSGNYLLYLPQVYD